MRPKLDKVADLNFGDFLPTTEGLRLVKGKLVRLTNTKRREFSRHGSSGRSQCSSLICEFIAS